MAAAAAAGGINLAERVYLPDLLVLICYNYSEAELIDFAATLSSAAAKVKKIHLYSNGLTMLIAREIGRGLSANDSVEEIGFRYFSEYNQGKLAAICESGFLCRMKTIFFESCDLDQAARQFISDALSARVVSVSFNGCARNEIIDLLRIRGVGSQLKSIEMLYAEESRMLTQEELGVLVGCTHSNLEELDLPCSGITNNAAIVFGKLLAANHGSLRRLNLSGNFWIDGDGIHALLLGLRKNIKVTQLFLRSDFSSARAIEQICRANAVLARFAYSNEPTLVWATAFSQLGRHPPALFEVLRNMEMEELLRGKNI